MVFNWCRVKKVKKNVLDKKFGVFENFKIFMKRFVRGWILWKCKSVKFCIKIGLVLKLNEDISE